MKVDLTNDQVEALRVALPEYIYDFNGQYDPDSKYGLTREDRQFLRNLRRIVKKLDAIPEPTNDA